MEYKSLNEELKRRFGTKVYKLSLASGCLCPNRDGLKGYGGCIFCSEGGSGDFAAARYSGSNAGIAVEKDKDIYIAGGKDKHIHIKEACHPRPLKSVPNSPSDSGLISSSADIGFISRAANPHTCDENDRIHTLLTGSIESNESAGVLTIRQLAAAPCIPVPSAAEQIAAAKQRVNAKFPAGIAEADRRYIAYFQSFTNTYGDIERLRALFTEAISQPEIAALSIGTRPDCLPPEMIAMLAELNRIKPVWVELGLQTIHARSTQLIRRAYPLSVFEKVYHQLKNAGLEVIVHVILGLPGESRADMLETVRWLSALYPQLDGIKLQLLHILRGTALENLYNAHPFHVMTLDEYCALIVDCLKCLPPETTVHRITGDGPKSLLIAPLWSADKKRVLNALRRAIAEA